jgi:hypothetical protein
LEDFEVLVDLGMNNGGNGDGGEARYWTCDFSYVSCVDFGNVFGFFFADYYVFV